MLNKNFESHSWNFNKSFKVAQDVPHYIVHTKRSLDNVFEIRIGLSDSITCLFLTRL